MEEVVCGGVYNWDRGGEVFNWDVLVAQSFSVCLLYTSPSPRDLSTSRMPSSA